MFDFPVDKHLFWIYNLSIEHLFREHLFWHGYTCIQFVFIVFICSIQTVISLNKGRIIMKKKTDRGQHRRLSKKIKRMKRLFTGFMLALVICVSGSAFLVSAHGITDSGDPHTYYKSIEIRKGDTLWEIAEQMKPSDCGSTAEYVQVLKDINNLESNDIQSGRHLIIAYDM